MPTVRSASTADSDPLIELTLRTIRTSYIPFLGEEAVEGYIASGAVETYVHEGIEAERLRLIATDDGTTAGHAAAKGDMLDLMLIDHRCHRQGLGRFLLEALESEMFATQDALRLESFEDNAVANAFYAHHGWRELGRHLDPDYGIRMLMLGKSK